MGSLCSLYSGLSEEAMQAMLEHDDPGDVSYVQRICMEGEIRIRRTLRSISASSLLFNSGYANSDSGMMDHAGLSASLEGMVGVARTY
jgi:hypothetical protein